jgi:hypothetical protein
MKKANTFFGSFFAAKDAPAEKQQSTPVVVTAYSQPHVLQQKMKEERLTHGETITANISPVRLENAYGRMILYFCPMKSIEVLQTINNGDGGALPAEAKVEGLSVPDDCTPGYYTLKNVVLSSNGTMQVKATNATLWEMVKPERF